MGKIACRGGCGAWRSTTVISEEGEHIPKCHICDDLTYVLIDPLSQLDTFLEGRLLGYHDRGFHWVENEKRVDLTPEETKKLLALVWV